MKLKMIHLADIHTWKELLNFKRFNMYLLFHSIG